MLYQLTTDFGCCFNLYLNFNWMRANTSLICAINSLCMCRSILIVDQADITWSKLVRNEILGKSRSNVVATVDQYKSMRSLCQWIWHFFFPLRIIPFPFTMMAIKSNSQYDSELMVSTCVSSCVSMCARSNKLNFHCLGFESSYFCMFCLHNVGCTLLGSTIWIQDILFVSFEVIGLRFSNFLFAIGCKNKMWFDMSKRRWVRSFNWTVLVVFD